jgi:hypothetical protein
VVRGALLRATQHLATAADYLAWRPLLHPVLARSRQTFAQATGARVDLDELAATARALLAFAADDAADHDLRFATPGR